MPGKLEQQDLEMEQQDLENKKAAREKQVDSERRIPSVILTTAPSIEGYGIADTGDIVTVECVKGMSMFKDWFSEARNLFGGRSAATNNVLRDARIKCLNDLQQAAYTVGAESVIAVDPDYRAFSGQGKSMLFLVASGAAVRAGKEVAG
jgi:uncharacterized protein YbjQ (UPF0145 family)